ncbi:Hypothetical predicted protein, partial [Paramuricea clavata]
MEDLELEMLADVDVKLNEQKTINKDLQKEKDSLMEQHNTKVKNVNEAQVAERVAKDAEIQDLKQQNHSLEDYIEGLGQDLDFKNKGRTLSEVCECQQRRKHGANHNLTYSEKVRKSYKDFAEADQQKARYVLFILDKFCIGDQAYHELSMLPGNEELPGSYLIKQCKDDINKLCDITRTPEPVEGAQLDFLKELESVIQNQ